jgi:hypothetical protein
MAGTLDLLEREAKSLAASPSGIGHIGISYALSYLDFHFAEQDWRRASRVCELASVVRSTPTTQATLPFDDS